MRPADSVAGYREAQMSRTDAEGPALLAARFRLGELLGTGGSASVFAAFDTRTATDIAVKILHPHLTERPAARDAFLAEAGRMEGLHHPNIVGVIDVGLDDAGDERIVWIAVERADGRSLSEHVARHGPLEPAEAVAVVDGMLRALEFAHAAGLVHRDVSPANVMVEAGSSGRIEPEGVRLLDFGLADAAGRTTLGTDDRLSAHARGHAGVIGNVNYLSPEQARGAAVDTRGDIYQAGAVLYFALTARAPFVRPTAEQTMRAHLFSPPPVPSVYDPRIPRELDRVVVRAMLKGPSDRFASANEMRSALTQLAVAPDRAWATLTTVAPAPRAASSVATATAADRAAAAGGSGTAESTRVLGRTVLPPREPEPVVPAPPPPSHSVRPSNSGWRARVGWLFAFLVAATAVTVILISAASTGPTAVVNAEPIASPTVAPPPVESPAPQATRADRGDADVRVVPELVGLTLGEAQAAIAEAGFATASVSAVDAPVRRDTIVSVEPSPGSRLRIGTPIALTVGSGLNRVPDVEGQGRDAAAALMHAAGFPASFAPRTVAPGIPAGSILGSDPAPGTSVAVGTPVTVWEAVLPDLVATPSPSPTRPAPSPTPHPTVTGGVDP
jgi:serine/threonine-protein kinase